MLLRYFVHLFVNLGCDVRLLLFVFAMFWALISIFRLIFNSLAVFLLASIVFVAVVISFWHRSWLGRLQACTSHASWFYYLTAAQRVIYLFLLHFHSTFLMLFSPLFLRRNTWLIITIIWILLELMYDNILLNELLLRTLLAHFVKLASRLAVLVIDACSMAFIYLIEIVIMVNVPLF